MIGIVEKQKLGNCQNGNLMNSKVIHQIYAELLININYTTS